MAYGLRSIGQVLAVLKADFPDVSISKIRFLESEGLISPERAPSGYRRYAESDIARLRYILTVQKSHYLPLKVIREHLEAMDRGEEPPRLEPISGAVIRPQNCMIVKPTKKSLRVQPDPALTGPANRSCVQKVMERILPALPRILATRGCHPRWNSPFKTRALPLRRRATKLADEKSGYGAGHRRWPGTRRCGRS